MGDDEAAVAADPSAAPVSPEPAPQAFDAPGVRNCDYQVRPDGCILFLRDGAVLRELVPDHELHAALRAEIREAYPGLPY